MVITMKYDPTPSVTPIPGQPEDATEQVNKFGTYNIQPTADTANLFPAIAQGLPTRPKRKAKPDRSDPS